MMKYYKDFNGSTAKIYTKNPTHNELIIREGATHSMIVKKVYKSLRGAKIALAKYGDSWREIPSGYSTIANN